MCKIGEYSRGKRGTRGGQEGRRGLKRFFLRDEMKMARGENNTVGERHAKEFFFFPFSSFHFVLSRSICIISKEVIARGAGP